jgi:hypothetical protein
MKKTSILLVVALTLVTGTGIGFLVASPKDKQPVLEVKSIREDQQVVNQVAEEQPAPPVTSVTWETTSHSFGEIAQNKPVKFKYEFTNNGPADLVIQNVKPACNCTTPEWSKDPVKPGQKGFVIAEFNAASEGIFKKSVTVTMNTEPSITVLNFDGTVIK